MNKVKKQSKELKFNLTEKTKSTGFTVESPVPELELHRPLCKSTGDKLVWVLFFFWCTIHTKDVYPSVFFTPKL